MSKFEDIKKETIDDLQAIIDVLAMLKDEVAAGDIGAVDRFFDLWMIFLLRHTNRMDQLEGQP